MGRGGACPDCGLAMVYGSIRLVWSLTKGPAVAGLGRGMPRVRAPEYLLVAEGPELPTGSP